MRTQDQDIDERNWPESARLRFQVGLAAYQHPDALDLETLRGRWRAYRDRHEAQAGDTGHLGQLASIDQLGEVIDLIEAGDHDQALERCQAGALIPMGFERPGQNDPDLTRDDYTEAEEREIFAGIMQGKVHADRRQGIIDALEGSEHVATVDHLGYSDGCLKLSVTPSGRAPGEVAWMLAQVLANAYWSGEQPWLRTFRPGLRLQVEESIWSCPAGLMSSIAQGSAARPEFEASREH